MWLKWTKDTAASQANNSELNASAKVAGDPPRHHADRTNQEWRLSPVQQSSNEGQQRE